MKKVGFISALLIFLMFTLDIKSKALFDYTPTNYNKCFDLVYGTNNVERFYYSDSALLNEAVVQVNIGGTNYNFCKPVGAIIQYSGYTQFYLFAYNSLGNGWCSTRLGSSDHGNINYGNNGLFTIIDGYSYELYGMPVFNNLTDASLYSSGEGGFNSDNLLGGDIPFQTPSIGEQTYENQIYNFQKVWNVYSRPTTRMSWNIAWIQHYDNDLYESSDYHRQIGITVKYPDYTSIANLYDSVFNEPQSFSTTLEYAKSFFTYDNMYDSRLTYKETTIWIDIDDMINDVEANGSSSQWYNWYQFTSNTDKNEYNFTLYETLENAFTAGNWGESYSYNPKGIVNIFRNYYNNDRLLLFALPFCIFDKAQMFTFNQPDNIVYNPIYIFWFDATAPDGTRSEKRNFGNPTNITSDNLVEPDVSNNNLGVPNGVPNPSEQQLASNYNSSIQDSYNNIYNNYYYTSEQNKDLLDYLMKYKDGGTEQDVQDAFGYVNTTIDSVSNVPVMLGKLFTGFFPPKVIMLFSALFIIFAVFIIVKIVRHLFL